MYCIHCGKKIDDDSVFCEYCGRKVDFTMDKDESVKLIRMRCSQCNSEMEIQESVLIGGMQVLVCPYCGSRTMVVQNDEVLKTNIVTAAKKEIELTKEKNKKEVKIASMQNNLEQKKIDREKWQSGFMKVISPFVFLGPGLLCFLISALWYSDSTLAAVVPFLLGTILVMTWLVHTFGNKTSLDKRAIVAILIGILMMYPAVSLYSCESERDTRFTISNSTYTWDPEVSELLPYPPSTNGKNDSLYGRLMVDVDVYNISSEQNKQYTQACKEYGFTIDPDGYSDDYNAFNAQGYKVVLDYWEYSKELNIKLYRPEEFGPLILSGYGLQSLLPEINAETGRIEVDSSEMFRIRVNNMSKSDCNAYIDECMKSGFIYDYRRSRDEASFTGHNEEGFEIHVYYAGFNIVSIQLSEPEEDK